MSLGVFERKDQPSEPCVEGSWGLQPPIRGKGKEMHTSHCIAMLKRLVPCSRSFVSRVANLWVRKEQQGESWSSLWNGHVGQDLPTHFVLNSFPTHSEQGGEEGPEVSRTKHCSQPRWVQA